MLLTIHLIKELQKFYEDTGEPATNVYAGSRAFKVLCCETTEELEVTTTTGIAVLKIAGVPIIEHWILPQDELIIKGGLYDAKT